MIRLSAFLVAASGLVFASNGQAAFLQVSPISLDLAAPARTATLTLRNEGDTPTNVQIRAYKWTQNAGVD